jgi:hypothetical protein
MNLLLNPESDLFSILLNDTGTPYIFRLFIDLTRVVEYRGKSVRIKDTSESIYVDTLEALVPDNKKLGITPKQRRTGINKLCALGVIIKKPSIKLPNSKRHSPQVIRFNINCELMKFKFSLTDKFVSKYEGKGEEVEINGATFIAPEWLNIEEFREDLSKWMDHVRGRVGFDRGIFEQDIHENLKDLFNKVRDITAQSKLTHKIYNASQNVSISKNNIISRCIEKGYTSFRVALEGCDKLFNDVKSSTEKSKKSTYRNDSTSTESLTNDGKCKEPIITKIHAVFYAVAQEQNGKFYEKDANALVEALTLKFKSIDFDKLLSIGTRPNHRVYKINNIINEYKKLINSTGTYKPPKDDTEAMQQSFDNLAKIAETLGA